VAEDGRDWIFGRNNDQKEWLTNYAAAIYIEESAGVTIRNSRVWHGQNALCLDRVTGKLTLETDQIVAIEVEHFQIDGFAVLDFSVQRWSEPVLPK
jgi:hypothetical protein